LEFIGIHGWNSQVGKPQDSTDAELPSRASPAVIWFITLALCGGEAKNEPLVKGV